MSPQLEMLSVAILVLYTPIAKIFTLLFAANLGLIWDKFNSVGPWRTTYPSLSQSYHSYRQTWGLQYPLALLHDEKGCHLIPRADCSFLIIWYFILSLGLFQAYIKLS